MRSLALVDHPNQQIPRGFLRGILESNLKGGPYLEAPVDEHGDAGVRDVVDTGRPLVVLVPAHGHAAALHGGRVTVVGPFLDAGETVARRPGQPPHLPAAPWG